MRRRRIVRYNSKRQTFFFFFLVSLCVISIGYATLQVHLNINGNIDLIGANWDIHFQNIQVSDVSNVVPEKRPIISRPLTTKYNVTLNHPGDTYIYTIEVNNESTYNAMIDSFTILPELTTDQKLYFRYRVYYDDENETPLALYQRLDMGQVERLVVEIIYDSNAPDGFGDSFQCSVDIVYVLADERAIDPHASSSAPVKLYDKVASYAVMDNVASEFVTASTGVDFTAISSDTNGKGVYTRAGTENDEYPVHYYRGTVTDNNILFANYCWKIVRTTSTGGVKLIYNGSPSPSYETTLLADTDFGITNNSTQPFTYNSTDHTWTSTMHTDNSSAEITFAIQTAGNYVLDYLIATEPNYDKVYFYKNGTELKNDSGNGNKRLYLDELTSSDTIQVKYQKDEADSYGNDNITFSFSLRGAENGVGCPNMGADSQIGTSSFNESYSTLADVGYMYGARYDQASGGTLSAATKYGSGFTYNNGTYTLTNTTTSTGNWRTDYNNLGNRHYTCFNNTGTCTTLNYIYLANTMTARYIPLTGGKSVENIVSEMITNPTNANNSTIKAVVDNWYADHIATNGDRIFIEDTVWCNDRSIYQLGGWNPNSDPSNIEYSMYFGGYNRAYNTYSPIVTCPSINDSFTVRSSNGNGKLQYPVGLITSDEAMLAGAVQWKTNRTFYLYSGVSYWTMTPQEVNVGTNHLQLYGNGGVLSDATTYSAAGVRPSISLIDGVFITGGDGGIYSPYTVTGPV